MTDDPTQEERRLVWEGGEFHPAQRGDTELWIAVPKKEWDEAVEALREIQAHFTPDYWEAGDKARFSEDQWEQDRAFVLGLIGGTDD